MKNKVCMSYKIYLITAFYMIFFLSACGYSKEEKQQMQKISQTGSENAINYIKHKYGFIAEVLGSNICMEQDGAFSTPRAEGCAVITMEYEGKEFQVHISGETDTLQGTDDFQHDVILEEAKAYFTALLGYEIYDIYLEYREQAIENAYAHNQEKNLISELYQEGDIENFIQRHPTNIRIDDCENQDFMNFSVIHAKAAAFLAQCAADCEMKTILISYKSEKDYQNGYKHTYGRGGVMDFGIEQDGLYICSYAVFEKGNTAYKRFELQTYDEIITSCIDKVDGSDLAISNQTAWKDLGETKKAPVSNVYSVERENAGETVVYLPTDKFGDWQGRQVYVQHCEKDKWFQYDVNLSRTKDKKYLFFTYFSIHGEGFDFAVFP